LIEGCGLPLASHLIIAVSPSPLSPICGITVKTGTAVN